jgi:hypothetical protein
MGCYWLVVEQIPVFGCGTFSTRLALTICEELRVSSGLEFYSTLRGFFSFK